MFSKLLPKDANFFDLFDKQADCAVTAAAYFNEIISKGHLDENTLSRMRDLEHQGDGVAHDIIEKLNKSFITPFDREDIFALVKELDDVIDMIYSIFNRLKVYQLEASDPHLVSFAQVIEQSVRTLAVAVRGMRNFKHSKTVQDACVEVNRLENVGDVMRDRVLAELFETKRNDPLAVIKWKEIYQDAETILDICEDVAHVVSSILVKHS
jgi:uncharacterized protein